MVPALLNRHPDNGNLCRAGVEAVLGNWEFSS
jgi:hypothetical protein